MVFADEDVINLAADRNLVNEFFDILQGLKTNLIGILEAIGNQKNTAQVNSPEPAPGPGEVIAIPRSVPSSPAPSPNVVPLPSPLPLNDPTGEYMRAIESFRQRLLNLREQIFSGSPIIRESPEIISQRFGRTLLTVFERLTALPPKSPGELRRFDEEKFVRGSLLVQFNRGFSPNSPAIAAINRSLGVREARELFPLPKHRNTSLHNIYDLKIPAAADPRALVESYLARPEVKYAEPNFIAQNQEIVPVNPLRADDEGWHIAKIKAREAWSKTQGDPETVIAIIDTGVRWSHPDLANNIWINKNEIPLNGKDDDQNGYIDDIRGWDFVETNSNCYTGEDCIVEDNNPDDFYGHGTLVAGAAAAEAQNNLGGAGVCPKCSIMPVRVGFALKSAKPDPSGEAEYDDIAEALVYAADNGADIINMSFMGAESTTVRLALEYASSKGKALVAAAGNLNTDSTFNAYPAAYQNVIAVAATDKEGRKASFSNYGTWVDIAAPGVEILTTAIPGQKWLCRDAGGGMGRCGGTSLAAPIVAGALGLAISKNPELNQKQLETLARSAFGLINSLAYIGPGVIDAFKIVAPDAVPVALFSPAVENIFFSHEPVNITGTVRGQNLEYQVFLGTSSNYPDQWIQLGAVQRGAVENNTLAVWQPSFLEQARVSQNLPNPGAYILRLVAKDSSGNQWEHRVFTAIDTTILPGWPKSLADQIRSAPALLDVSPETRGGELFFQATNFSATQITDRFYLLGSSGASLNNWPIVPPGFGVTPNLSPAVANIDSDSDFEAVFGRNSLGASQYFVYETDGTLERGWPITVGTNYKNFVSWGSPVIADLDNDGAKEIILLTEDGGRVPGGAENKIYVYGADGKPKTGWPKKLDGRPRGTPAVGDVNGDGDLEIVVSSIYLESAQGYLYVFNHDGSPLTGWPKNAGGFSSPILADLDQTDGGKLEIIQGVGNFLYVWNDDATPLSGWPVGRLFPTSYSPAIGDLDNDGDLEIVFGTSNGYVYAMNHDGRVLTGWPASTGNLMSIDGSPIIVDLDGNGQKEVLIGTSNAKKLFGFRADGSPIAGFPKLLLAHTYAPAAGDINGDGKIEVFVVDALGNLYLWPFSGPATQEALSWPMFRRDPQHTGKY